MEEKIKKHRNPIISVFKEEWKHLGNQKKTFIFYIILFLIAGSIMLMTPLLIGMIFNTVQESITSKTDLNKLLFLISLLLAIEVGFWIFHGWGRVVEQKTGFLVYRNFINSKIKKVLELPVQWQKDHHSGDTIDKINKAADGLNDFSQHFTFSIVYALLNIFGSLTILFFIDYKIATFTLIFSCTTILIIIKVDKILIDIYKKLNKKWNKLSSSIFDYISNIITVITLRLKKTVSKEVDNKIMDAYDLHNKSIKISESKWAIASIAIGIMTVLVLMYKSYTDYTTTGVILIGTLYILYGYLERVGKTFFSFAQLYHTVVKYDAMLMGVSSIDEEYNKIKDETRKNLPIDWNKLEIRDLNFKYEEGSNKRHLDNINIDIKRGKKIALIGESGSGKSTILSVLRGLYPPKSGKIIYKGNTLDNGFARLKHSVTLIPQDPGFNNNSISGSDP